MLDEAAADRRKFRRLAALSGVHEAPGSPRELARMRDVLSSRPLCKYLPQTIVGHAHMLPPVDPAQTPMTDYPAA